MSLEKTQWRYLGVVQCSAADVSTIVNGIYNLGLITTYPDGSPRTPGSGSAGTYNLVTSGTTRVLHIDPAVRTINNKIVLACDTGGTANLPTGASRLPTLASGESGFPSNKAGVYWNVNGQNPRGTWSIFSTIIKNPGAYSHWTAVNPFTSGSFYGYYRSLVTTASGFTGNVYVYESRDCLAIAFVGPAPEKYFLLAGAILDPESPDTTLDAEADGKLYGIMSGNFSTPTSVAAGGVVTVLSQDSWAADNTGQSGLRSTTTLSVFQPNTNNILRVIPITWTVNTTPSAAMFTRSSRLVKIPIVYRSLSSSHTLGRLRDIYLFGNSRIPRRLMNGNVPLGYVFGSSDSADTNCIFLEH
jgi:hypothetical protein